MRLIDDLLAMVAASGGGCMEDRIRIQKTAYLLRWAGLPIFKDLRFRFSTHGPSSRELSDVLHDAVEDGLLTESSNTERDTGAADTVYSYKITPAGSQRRVYLHMNPSLLRFFVARLNTEHWRTLELAASALFLQEDEDLPRTPWDRVVVLRPAFLPCLGKAKDLVVWLSYLKERNPVWPDMWGLQLEELRKIAWHSLHPMRSAADSREP